MILNPEQETFLTEFDQKYDHFKNLERTLEMKLRQELENRLKHLRTDASLAGNRAVAAGVPISRLGDKSRPGMQTKSFRTIVNFLELTSKLPDAEQPIQFGTDAERFTRTADGAVLVRPYKGEVESVLPFLGWSSADLAERPDLLVAEFRMDEAGRITNITPDWLEEDGDRHPVVALMASSEKLQGDLREWLKK